jgi:hypothetical protein
MRIVIGETNDISSAGQYRLDNEPVSVEARLLEIRDRRESTDSGKAASGRVITLLVPEGQKIPRGIESGDYRIYLRFVHRRNARV